MKKNKLFKTLGCLAGISAIGSIAPIVTTSCGCSNKTNIIPENAYCIDNDGLLTGWADGWNPERVKNAGYDTMILPESVKKIDIRAFENSSIGGGMPPLKLVLDSNLTYVGIYAFNQTPIISIDFSKCAKLEKIDDYGFNGSASESSGWSTLTEIDLSPCTNLSFIGMDGLSKFKFLTSVTLPGSLNDVGMQFLLYDDYDVRNIDITWNDLTTNPQKLNENAFNLGIGDTITGTIKSASDDYSSQELYDYLISHGNLPSTFNPAAD